MGLFLTSLFCFFGSIPGFMPVLYCFDYVTFVIYFLIRMYDGSRFVVLSQDGFGYSGSLWLHRNFRIAFTLSVRNAIGYFTEIALNL